MTRQGQFILAVSGAYAGSDANLTAALTDTASRVPSITMTVAFSFYVQFLRNIQSRFRSRRGASYFVRGDKVSKTPFLACSPKVLKITVSV